MCVTLTKQAGFNDVEGKDNDELLECCDNDMSTDKLEQLPQAYMALTGLSGDEETTVCIVTKDTCKTV
jgi:hypothetical protein